MEYRDQDGQLHTGSEVVGIPVHKSGRTFVAETGSKLIVKKGQRVSRSPVPAGETFDIALDIWNAAEIGARNIRVSVAEDDTGALCSFAPVGTSNVLFIPELAAKKRNHPDHFHGREPERGEQAL